MGPFGVELVCEGVEPGLLLKAVHAWRASGFFFQGEMHAFMAAVLLGMSGLDAFDRYAEPQPPDGKFGKIEQSVWACERNAVVGSDRLRQAAFEEQLFEGGEGGFSRVDSRASQRSRKRDA